MKRLTPKKSNRSGKTLRGAAAVLVAAVLLSSLAGVAYALLRDTTARVDNTVTEPKITCAVEEKFDGDTKEEVKVRNTGDAPAYIRVKVIYNWVDTNGYVFFAKPDGYSCDGQLADPLKWTHSVSGTGFDQLPDGYWYYNGIVQPGDATEDLIARITALYPIDPIYSFRVRILAEAIQAAENQIGGKSASEERWGMKFNGSSWVAA